MYEFRWNAWNRAKCDKHNVLPEEAEHVVNHPWRGFPRKIGGEKKLVQGQAPEGTYMQVIYVVDEDDTVFVIHARPLTNAEKQALRRRR